ncbi:MAG: trypsin-like peptidase domain-containing protein [Bryobacterales bacterium]|nr:trypsin-like peptidase domain-containing protein [Bryobacterales bacterium]
MLRKLAPMAAVASFWLACGAAPGQAQAKAANPLEALSQGLQQVTAKVAPSVVQIQVTRFAPDYPDAYGTGAAVLGREQAVGSGIVIHPDGYIVTNAHVVQGAQRIRVNMLEPTAEGAGDADAVLTQTLAQAIAHPHEATLVGMLEEFDIALIKVKGEKLPVLPFADYRNVRQGQLVFAFGSRDGLEHSVSMGVVSSVARQPEPDSPYLFIQTDAAINPGDSGGPLVNTAGEVVGMNTFILSKSGGSEGLGFAIPSPMIQFVAGQLRELGHLHRPMIGIGVQAVTPVLAEALRLARSSGVIVSDITADSPAEKAGLKLNDLIVSVEGRPVHNVPMFAMTMLQSKPNQPLKMEILRGGRPLTLAPTPTVSEDHPADSISDLVDPEKDQVPRLGIVAIKVDPRVAALLPGLRNASGVYVAARMDIVSGTTSGVRVGDVIHEINGSVVLSVESLNQQMNAMQRGDAVALLIERDGHLLYEAFEAE